tara:strand:+ start:65206 stop:65724 length:519 start_codon:yes stop_codon:yes gene_type:complete
MPITEYQQEITKHHNQPAQNPIDSIYETCAVPPYKPQKGSREATQALLAASVQAPTTLHAEPWVFMVIQDAALLRELSDDVRESAEPQMREYLHSLFREPDFNILYNAETLIVIYGKSMGASTEADYWLTAENLILAASAMGYGTCVIGLAVQKLNTPEWKFRLGATFYPVI